MSSAVASSDVILSPAASACDCCYVSVNSECCLDCLTRAPELGALAPLSALLAREEDVGDEYGTSDASAVSEAAAKEAGGWLPGCRCCFRERLLHHGSRHSILGVSCCSICQRSKRAALKLQASLESSALSPGYNADGSSRGSGVGAGGDAAVSGGGGDRAMVAAGSGRVQKRMSMECFCCSNSGIAACCSNCRLMV
nr:hypothetical protein BaRGS_033010 [Batillaria attramentaria]